MVCNDCNFTVGVGDAMLRDVDDDGGKCGYQKRTTGSRPRIASTVVPIENFDIGLAFELSNEFAALPIKRIVQNFHHDYVESGGDLNRALDALEQDDIDEAARMITIAGNDKKDSRWRLICQQVIFRCRILVSLHREQMERITQEIEIFGKSSGLHETYRLLRETEAKAVEILSNYEASLLKQLTGGHN